MFKSNKNYQFAVMQSWSGDDGCVSIKNISWKYSFKIFRNHMDGVKSCYIMTSQGVCFSSHKRVKEEINNLSSSFLFVNVGEGECLEHFLMTLPQKSRV